ncbi:piggyBac transposable element-derived protein 3-like [Liolophura sinensis]|uniref:piggyBac transposable element-derived protein 3-like n=1 Tax=Liolophura sinensis TaxID=3198878 RepID=UPI0031584513
MAASITQGVRSFYGRQYRPRYIQVDIPDDSEDDLSSDEDFNMDNLDTDFHPNDDEGSSGSEDSTEDETITDDQSLPSHPQTQKSSRTNTIKWNKSAKLTQRPEADFPERRLTLNQDFLETQSLSNNSSPISFFRAFMDENYIKEVAFQTNLYSTQSSQASGSRAPPAVTVEEINKALGILLYMGVVKMPNRRMYWCPSTKVPLISESMSRNRFERIMSCLHFNDNSSNDGTQKLFKIQPFLDHVQQRFKGVVVPETYQCIDEMMVAFKGRHSLKQYMPKKPSKWGYKLWARAGVSGYVYDFEVCGGGPKGPPSEAEVPKVLGESECVVLRLIQPLAPKQHKIFFDNYFSSPELLVYLKEQGHFAVCTIRQNRLRHCPVMSEKDIKKAGRGSMDQCVDKDNNVVVCAWQDSRRVLTASNYVGVDPVDECKRYDRKLKQEITIPRPAIVSIYNKFMGGVDKADMMISLYKTKFRCRK